MNKSSKVFEVEGVIMESLPNTMFRIKLIRENNRLILATLTGKIRRGFVRIFPGDTVIVEMTVYDKDRGRIVRKVRAGS